MLGAQTSVDLVLAHSPQPPAIHVWSMSGPRLADLYGSRIVDVLDQDEQRRLRRLTRIGDRTAYIAAHVLARLALSTCTGENPASLRFERGPHGKPSLRGLCTPNFSLSHTNGLAVCAVASAGDVGVDAERCDRAFGGLVLTDVLAEAEIAAVAAAKPCDRAMLILQLWTLKESYLKLSGLGLVGVRSMNALAEIAFAINDGVVEPLSRLPAKNKCHFSILSLGEQHVGAVAVMWDSHPQEPTVRMLDGFDLLPRSARSLSFARGSVEGQS
jgi:phosphopantetheinyl transferase